MDVPGAAEAPDPIAAFVQPHLSAADLRRVTLSGTRAGGRHDLRKAVVRPVEVQGRRALQVVTYDARRSTTSNVPDATAPEVRDLLRAPFRHVVVELASEVLEGRVTKKGGLVTSRTSVEERPVDLGHDRRKARPIPEDAPFLELLGISSGGRVKPSRQAKYRQINDFIRLLDSAPSFPSGGPDGTVRVVDLGCGNAYLTFAVYHHLTITRGLPCALVGVDRTAELIERNGERADGLGWGGLRFEAGDIASYQPDDPPDLVVALHACDTASDHALASYVRWGSDLAMVAPCCHHDLHTQLHSHAVAPGEAVLLRHGIIRERFGDVLTDAARAAILRVLGHDVDVVEFVSPEHTPKNVLIRAANRGLPVPADLVPAYLDLMKRWRVRPFLAELLRDQLAERGA
jgi:SAM-dependent methyltransferase